MYRTGKQHQRTVQVLLHPRRRNTFRQHNSASLNMPRYDDLSGCDAQLLCDFLNLFHVKRVSNTSITSERRVCLEEEPVFLGPFQELDLGEPEIDLDLVDGGLVLEGVGSEVLETADAETGDEDGLAKGEDGICEGVCTYLLRPIFRTLPFSTISSSFCHVG